MATPSPIATFFILSLSLALLLLTPSHVQAQSPASPPVPVNLTATLEKGGQYTILIRLLASTHIDDQIINQVNNSDQGLTLFAPTDNAFNSLKPGTLNGLSQQEQVALLLYHVLPRFYSFDMFDTISNPVRTQASGNDGGNYFLNFTSSANQLNVSTGVVDVTINNALRSRFPLAVYEVDEVLLPLDLFGPKPNKTEAPAPAVTPPVNRPPRASSSSSSAPSASEESAPNAGWRAMSVGWGGLVGVVMVMVGIVW